MISPFTASAIFGMLLDTLRILLNSVVKFHMQEIKEHHITNNFNKPTIGEAEEKSHLQRNQPLTTAGVTAVFHTLASLVEIHPALKPRFDAVLIAIKNNTGIRIECCEITMDGSKLTEKVWCITDIRDVQRKERVSTSAAEDFNILKNTMMILLINATTLDLSGIKADHYGYLYHGKKHMPRMFSRLVENKTLTVCGVVGVYIEIAWLCDNNPQLGSAFVEMLKDIEVKTGIRIIHNYIVKI